MFHWISIFIKRDIQVSGAFQALGGEARETWVSAAWIIQVSEHIRRGHLGLSGLWNFWKSSRGVFPQVHSGWGEKTRFRRLSPEPRSRHCARTAARPHLQGVEHAGMAGEERKSQIPHRQRELQQWESNLKAGLFRFPNCKIMTWILMFSKLSFSFFYW